MSAQLAPMCFPLLDGCLSISAACRSEPVIYLFRTFMLPMSFVLMLFWWHHRTLLNQLLPRRPVLSVLIATSSLTGSAFLTLYVIFLGTDGNMYEFLRRLGIYVFFAGTGIAQLFTTLALRSVNRSFVIHRKSGHLTILVWRIQFLIVITMLLVGPLNLFLKATLAEPKQAENIIEWNFGLIMFLWYALQAKYVQLTDTNCP
ncbi:MAG: hypothetical protein KTR32_04420 [Granulosicoccus sp.]|nr:hypothetical protein [Granulosicoccus sp.]